jgi:hypothetical protein
MSTQGLSVLVRLRDKEALSLLLGKIIFHPPEVGRDFQFDHQNFNFLN